MTDLFTETAPPSFTQREWENYLEEQSEMGRQMAALVQAEEEYRIDNGIIAPWVESDFLIAKDERRLLTLIADAAGYVRLDNDMVECAYGYPDVDSLFPCLQPERMVSRFTNDMQMNAEANSKAVLNAAIERGLVTVTRDNSLPGVRLDMTKRGAYYLDIAETNDYWESEESE